MLNITATYTDLYQLTMAQVYFKTKPNSHAVFDYFFRRIPFNNGYALFSGLENFLELLDDFRFSKSDLEYLKGFGFEAPFLNYLKNFRFTGNIFSIQEGDLIFPNQPVIQVSAPIIEAQLVETLLLNILNFQTLVATKASRIRNSAEGKVLLDMGLRRAHATGGYYATRATIIGGFNSTSNVVAAKDFDIPCSGTMAHSLVQSYTDELEAFRDFAAIRPQNAVLLVDTYDTLKSGIPNAITVAKEMEAVGNKLLGVRLDSGDLAYLSKKARHLLDEAGLSYVKIVASNQLDEYVIKSLKEQEAPIDIYGVGTNLVTGKPDAALDGVYKLSEFDDSPRIKISESVEKVSLPGKKQIYRMLDKNGMFYGADMICLSSEKDVEKMLHPRDVNKFLYLNRFIHEPLLKKVVENGKRVFAPKSVKEISEFAKKRLAQLPSEFKRFEFPHIYKVGLSPKLKQERDRLITQHRPQKEEW